MNLLRRWWRRWFGGAALPGPSVLRLAVGLVHGRHEPIEVWVVRHLYIPGRYACLRPAKEEHEVAPAPELPGAAKLGDLGVRWTKRIERAQFFCDEAAARDFIKEHSRERYPLEGGPVRLCEVEALP